ncbi:MAG: Pvc16 family protein [Solirubrobacterales bacterium]
MAVISAYTAFGDAGNTLVDLLRDSLTPGLIQNPEMIGLCSPADKGDLRLTVYPYSIKENREFRRGSGMPVKSYTGYYLLTAHSKAEIQLRAFDEAAILGGAIQTLANNGIIPPSYLRGSLLQQDEELKMAQYYIAPEEMSKIWFFPNIPYKLSVGFMVWPIVLDLDAPIVGVRVSG